MFIYFSYPILLLLFFSGTPSTCILNSSYSFQLLRLYSFISNFFCFSWDNFYWPVFKFIHPLFYSVQFVINLIQKNLFWIFYFLLAFPFGSVLQFSYIFWNSPSLPITSFPIDSNIFFAIMLKFYLLKWASGAVLSLFLLTCFSLDYSFPFPVFLMSNNFL